MVKGAIFFFVSIFIILVLISVADLANPSKIKIRQGNNPPLVKITAPKNNSFFEWDSPMKYTISVTDKEDGDSKFDEIPSNEVLLQVRYIVDTSKVAAELNSAGTTDLGFAAMRTSNCLNCHNFNSKLIGPSFYDISKRYPNTRANLDLLTKHVLDGSKGVWGDVSMPTHPELTKEETENIINWIFRKGLEPDVYYYRGTEGSFKLKSPASPDRKGILVLTATYTDHGLKDKPKQNLMGQDVILLRQGQKM